MIQDDNTTLHSIKKISSKTHYVALVVIQETCKH